MDINETYVYESDEEKDLKDRVIVRTVDIPTEEKFTITDLEAKQARIDDQITSLEADKAKIQDKIDEATEALTVVEK